MDIFLFLFLGVSIGVAGGMHWGRLMLRRELRKDVLCEQCGEEMKKLRELKRAIRLERPDVRSNAVSLLNVLKV